MPSRFEGALEGGADPGAGVDVAFGAQSGEGVVEVGREPKQQGFVFHLMSEYIAGTTDVSALVGGLGRSERSRIGRVLYFIWYRGISSGNGAWFPALWERRGRGTMGSGV